MTDEEVINQALKAVNEYAKQHKGSDFDIDESVKRAVKAVEPVWRSVRFSGRILKPSQALELKEITSELRARGYMFHYDWQKSKVVVTIKISDTLACTQEIKYSDIKRGLLPGIIADVAEAVDLLIGKNLKVSVWKMSNDWKRWVTWSS